MHLNWVTIKTQNFEAAKKFYSEYLELELAREFSPNEYRTIAFFDVDNSKIELLYDKNTADNKVENTNVSIGLVTDKYDYYLKKAHDAGMQVSGPVQMGGGREWFFVADPDGVEIQIIKG